MSPPKSYWICSRFNDIEFIEERKLSLESYLRVILHSNEQVWLNSEVWKQFLNISIKTNIGVKSKNWIEEFDCSHNLVKNVRSTFIKKEAAQKKRNTKEAHEYSSEARKELINLNNKIQILENGLINEDSITKGELFRRKELLFYFF